MAQLTSLFELGQRVAVWDGEIHGRIQRIDFFRNMTTPLYHVEWMFNGDLYSGNFHEQDLADADKPE